MNDNILLSGSRDGKVRVYDLRSDRSEQSSDQSVLQHTSTITHLRALRNGHHLLVNGLQNSAALYDLRFQKEDAVMTYPTTNLSSTTLGFGLSRSEDIFAVAGEDATARLYSTYTGKLLRTLELLEDSHNFVELLWGMAPLRVSIEGLSEHSVLMSITYLSFPYREAIDFSQDTDPSYLVTVAKFAIGNI